MTAPQPGGDGDLGGAFGTQMPHPPTQPHPPGAPEGTESKLTPAFAPWDRPPIPPGNFDPRMKIDTSTTTVAPPRPGPYFPYIPTPVTPGFGIAAHPTRAEVEARVGLPIEWSPIAPGDDLSRYEHLAYDPPEG
jgi:hypothetical protein